MAYGDYKNLSEFSKKFGIANKVSIAVTSSQIIEPSDWLKDTLRRNRELPIKSEKSRSELIVSPILMELRERNDKFFTIYSGDNLNIDEENGLKGECDFILAKDNGTFDVSAPIMQVVEAKKNDIEIGIPQCAAQMLGAKIFNEREGNPTEIIYGCVTTGDDWLFMKLENNLLLIDNQKYYLGNLNQLLGTFQTIIDYYKGKI
jgi:hypothetical protein